MLKEFFTGFKVPAKLYWDSYYENIISYQSALRDHTHWYWLNYSAFKWTWWFLLFWTIFPLFIWWKFIDRKRFLEISFFGVLISICAGILDSAGVFNLLWTYPYSIVSFLPNFFPIDYVVLPVVFMLIYQKYSGWKGYIIVVTIVSSFLSLVLDPVIVWMNLYQPLAWQYIYSVPVFVFMSCFCKWLTMIITGQDLKYGGHSRGNQAA